MLEPTREQLGGLSPEPIDENLVAAVGRLRRIILHEALAPRVSSG